jgi:hypothetical protein
MSCPACFFQEDYQKQLKMRTFGESRFEKKFFEYKNVFIGEIGKLESVSKCGCDPLYSNADFISWADDFLNSLKSEISEIESAFTQIGLVYENFVKHGQKSATNTLWKYLSNQGLLTHPSHSMEIEKLFFRARKKGDFNEHEIREYFHIPFTKRHLVGNQRFSVSGQPMLYFASSILNLTKELGSDVSELAISAFLPDNPDLKIFDLHSQIGTTITNSLPALFGANSKIKFADDGSSPNRNTLKNDLHRVILIQSCTFPVEFHSGFCAEYVVPQILTTALLEHDYKGIFFPSTKDYSSLDGHHRFSSHHINFAMFVPYDGKNDWNENLLTTFRTFTLSGKEENIFTADEIILNISNLLEKTAKSLHNNNSYLVPLVQTKLHIEYLIDSEDCGEKYFQSKPGRLELKFYMKMICTLESLIK